MLRLALLLATLTGLAAAQAAPPTPPSVPQARPDAPSTEPSDPAAIGFLKTTVDHRVYSLESAGARKLTSIVKATFEVTDRFTELKPTTVDLEVMYDFASGATKTGPRVPPSPEQQQILVLASAAAQNAFSPLPSRAARGWKVTFANEGEQVRLDYFPRNTQGVIESYSEWYKLDGTPLRRKVISRTPKDGALVTITQEIALAYDEAKQGLLLKELKPLAVEGQLSYTFEYELRDGLQVLKRLIQQDAGWRLTLDFNTTVERANTVERPAKQ